jgi:Glycoside hydrolase 97.
VQFRFIIQSSVYKTLNAGHTLSYVSDVCCFAKSAGMVCDYPAAYEGQPGFEFIKEVPTNWDETKVIDAKLAEYVVIARKKENDWFVGSINDHSARTIKVLFHF